MRIDKYLWCIRLFKTRSLSTKNCNGERVKLNGVISKPSRTISIDDMIAIKDGAYWRTYQVLDLPKSRVGAKLVQVYVTETTEDNIKQQLEDIQRVNRENKILGIKGRPTKKARRTIDKWKKL